MILVAIVAALQPLLEEYTAAMARAVERLLSAAAPRRILPRRMRFLLVLRNSLHFAAPPPPHAVVAS
ncbi:hypothetical protein HU200_039510 [Digitaria exilis]|uniref:Uncharacterized protein n=1 Tax=Digitaria exilis TaxID=1010633 RepID=A0A835BAM9_9POAL|nr:hypothetical protein HU200_039510 [Digitaria exilis]CAB3452811.1 unnamed protein product [Digitaria exilis]